LEDAAAGAAVRVASDASKLKGDTVMTGNEKRAYFYRENLADDQSLRPLTIALITIVAAWLIIYLLGSATDRISAQADGPQDNHSLALSLVGP
jgi:hypothetical protein